jgi:hypothetical protein
VTCSRRFTFSSGAASRISTADVRRGSIGDLANVLARGTEVPEEFYFASGLMLLGSACATELTLNTGMEVEPRLYMMLLGQSYEAKKSTAVKRMVQFFEDMWSGCGGPRVAWGVGSAEGLARELGGQPQACAGI